MGRSRQHCRAYPVCKLLTYKNVSAVDKLADCDCSGTIDSPGEAKTQRQPQYMIWIQL
jgi:hypothetical protein